MSTAVCSKVFCIDFNIKFFFCLYFKASDPISSTFNIDGGPLPSGQLTPNNQAALQTGLNGYLVTQKEFSRCALQLTNGNVRNCALTRKLLLNTRKRRQES
jgi:hypothetical protein